MSDTVLNKSAAARPAGEETLELAISGMTCAACSTRLEKVLNRLPGVQASVNLATERASLRFAPGVLSLEAATAAVERAGFGASVAGEREVCDLPRRCPLPGG